MLKISWFFDIPPISLKALKMEENGQKLPFLDIFAFSSTFFVLKVKYYHLSMHGVEHLWNLMVLQYLLK